jgi:hypothetical protein
MGNGRWPPVISDSGLLGPTCEQTENITITVGGIKTVNILPSLTVPFAKKRVPVPFNKKGEWTIARSNRSHKEYYFNLPASLQAIGIDY